MKIVSVNISKKKGTPKKPVARIVLTPEGVQGDAHAGTWNRQVSLLGTESVEKFRKETGKKAMPGEFAENITTTGMTLWNVHPLDRFISGKAVLEVTQIGKNCHGSTCAIFREVGNCIMPKEGIFCRVVKPGILKAGMEMHYSPKTYKVHVITLSDRAFAGEYDDRSGPRIGELLDAFFSELHLPSSIFFTIIPDDPIQLRELISGFVAAGSDMIFTTGGTGIGPRDLTPEAIQPLLDKEIPGLMEMIRIKFGASKPAALLSRSIAGVAGSTLIYALPGSVKAVDEYIPEILNTLIHSIFMIHRLDIH